MPKDAQLQDNTRIAAAANGTGPDTAIAFPRISIRSTCTQLDITPTGRYVLQPSSIARSRLLTGIHDQEETSAAVHLPVEPAPLLAWLMHVQPDSQPIQQPDQPATGDPCAKQVPGRAGAAEPGPSAAVATTDAHESVPNGDDVAAAPPHNSAKQPKPKAAGATRTQPTRAARAARKRPAPASGTPASAASKRSTRARQQPAASQTMQDEGAGMSAVATATALLQVADVLDDATTQAEACAVLTAKLQAECSTVSEASRKLPTAIAKQVLARLSDDTAFSVLQAMHVPLATLLIYLSATPFCPLAIRALHPSIDSHATLALPPWPPLIGVAASAAIATFTHLEALSITGLGSPIPLIAIVRALPRLTSLSLRNNSLAHVAARIAKPLQQLTDLQSLDLSHNCLDSFFTPLAAALPTLPALHTLRLAGTLSTCASIRELADALPQMSALTHLSVGGPAPLSTESAAWGSQCDPASLSVDELLGLFKKGSAREEETQEGNNLKDVEEADGGKLQHPIRGLLSLAAALLSATSLRSLDFGFDLMCSYQLEKEGWVARLGAALGNLRQLRHLGVRSIHLFNLGKRLDPKQAVLEAPGGQIRLRSPGAGFGMLTGLTSLDCRLFSTGLGVLDRDRTVEFAKNLQPLKGLRSLRFPDAMLPTGGCKHVWQSLSRLKRLTHVDVSGLQVHARCDRPALVQVVQKLVALPHMQSVEGPWFPHANYTFAHEVPVAELSDSNRAAAAAFAGAAAAGKAVKLDMRSTQEEAARLRADEVGPALPLCGTVELDFYQPVRAAAAVDVLAQLPAVTALILSLPGAGPPHEDVDSGDSGDDVDDDAEALAAEGPLEPVRSAPWSGLLSACGQLTQLRRLQLMIETRPAYKYAEDRAVYRSVARLARSVADALTPLQQLTALSFRCGTLCWGAGLPAVLEACGGLPELRHLWVDLVDEEVDRLRELIIVHDEFGTDNEEDQAEIRTARAVRPDFTGFSTLTGLQALSINSSGSHDVGNLIRGALPRMPRLQFLSLTFHMDSKEVGALAACVREHLRGLRDLYVRQEEAEGEYVAAEAEGVSAACVAQLREGLSNIVRVHWADVMHFVGDSDLDVEIV